MIVVRCHFMRLCSIHCCLRELLTVLMFVAMETVKLESIMWES